VESRLKSAGAASPSPKEEAELKVSYAWCRDLTRRSQSNFYYSFFTLPKPLFRDMCVLYAFMRVSDDLGDDQQLSVDRRAELIADWRAQLAGAVDSRRLDHPLLPALLDVISRHAVPPQYLFDVIDGVEMDLHPAGFETFEELSDYCYHVAGAVGLCCIHIWGFSDPEAIPLAIECGLAFQLTNILRDLAEDARVGRCYLPREDLRRFGLTTSDLGAAMATESFRKLIAWEITRTRHHFTNAEKLLGLVNRPGKPILASMLQTYSALLDEVDRRGAEVEGSRVHLGRFRKVRIALWSLLRYRWLAPR
jgi:phytoene synthase